MVDIQACLHGLGSVVLADGQLTAAEVALAFHLGRIGDDVERGAAVLAGPAARHTLDDGLVRDLDREGGVDVDAMLLQSFRLGDGARHTVEDITIGAVGLSQTLADDADDDVVRNELAAFHVGFCFQAHGRAVFHGRAQDVAGGNGGDIQLAAEDLSLRALARTGGA